MATGTVQTILVCAPSWTTQAPCPSGQAVAVVQAYVVDPSQAATFEAATAPFDYTYAAGLWSLAFTMVVGLFLVSRSAGTILNFIRGRG